MTKKPAKKPTKPKTKPKPKPKPTDRKPPASEKGGASDGEKPPDNQVSTPALVAGSDVPPLDPGILPERVPVPPSVGPKDRGGRPPLTADEKKDRAAARQLEKEEAKEALVQAARDKVELTTKIVVGIYNTTFHLVLPPPLTDDENAMLCDCWRPLIEKYDGDIPPWLGVALGTLAVFAPRISGVLQRRRDRLEQGATQ